MASIVVFINLQILPRKPKKHVLNAEIIPDTTQQLSSAEQ